ncbi:RNA polymerase sigma factor [Zavarzinella formosa]|uniref:RNA polymerase sigma factor n=1 Tax=Zavarzinella formosa TaxID=360055 RepID=UPI0004958FE0|nr:sigma-70 family RNA polymerase sigma factor [Zavarzinella formosa]
MLTTAITLLDKLRIPGHPDAWPRFVRLYAPLLLCLARRQGFKDADSEDLIQEVFLKLMRLFPTYQRGQGQTFRGWLATVVRSQSHDFRRRRATRPLPGADDKMNEAEDTKSGNDWWEGEYRLLLARRALDMIRRDFSEATWAAFSGMMLDGKPAVAVAADLGVRENVVYLARHRVLTRLREEVAGLMD